MCVCVCVLLKSHINLKGPITGSEHKDQHNWTFLWMPVYFNTVDQSFCP